MKRWAAILMAGATAWALGGLIVAVHAGPPNALDDFLSDLHRRGLFDGAVVVSYETGTVFAKGYGFANAQRGVPFTPDTPADGASLAKTFTAALLLGLEHDGVVDLDKPARALLPQLPYPAVTLRHLLSHTSGIPVSDSDFFNVYLPAGEVRTTERLLRVLADHKPELKSVPGERFEYSSFGYDLAALAASRAAGRTYLELVRDRFFRPLGIGSAFARPARFADFPGIRTLGYRRSAGTLEVNDVFDLEAFHGGSNLYISANDLNRRNRSFFNAQSPVRIAGLLERARVGGAASGLTLGSWYRNDAGTAFWYSGHLQGFHSEVFRDMTSKESIVFMSNNTIEPWLQKGIRRGRAAVPLYPAR